MTARRSLNVKVAVSVLVAFAVSMAFFNVSATLAKSGLSLMLS